MFDELFDLSQHFILNYNRSYKRYFLAKYPLENRFSIITGPRGVGKTSAIIQYLLKFTGGDRFNKEAIYIQADHFLVGKLLYPLSIHLPGVKIVEMRERSLNR